MLRNPGSRHSLIRSTVLRYAPESSGVFGLFSAEKLVYVGSAGNIRKVLLECLHGGRPQISEWEPSHFTFELCSPSQRAHRQKELVELYHPVANSKLVGRKRKSKRA